MSKHNLIIKDAVWQIAGRIISAFCGFFVIKIITPYLWVFRYGDYSTILKYFAIFSALADFGLYVIAVKRMGAKKEKNVSKQELENDFGKYIWTRFFSIIIVYTIALVIAYLLPAYTSNPFLIWGLPLGMVFSASFMAAGIMQLPLQLFWRMKDLSISLILARVTQFAILLITVFVLFPWLEFQQDGVSVVNSQTITAFMLILFSVVASAWTQMLYVWWKSNKYLKLKVIFDFKFIKKFFTWNWMYWISYYLSSFHTLVVLIFLSVMFPSVEGFEYVWLWALALSLIEIFLIVPSALWNSMLHSVSENPKEKKKSFWNLMSLVFVIWVFVLINFTIFSSNIVNFISGDEYLGTSLLSDPGANTILPFLGFVLVLSFVKQIFNYIFVANEKQNKLFWINLVGVIIWTVVWLITIPKYWIVGGIITQVLLEILFVSWAIIVAKNTKTLPIVDWKNTWILSAILVSAGVLWYSYISIWLDNDLIFFGVAIVFNLILVALCFPFVKRIAKGLGG